MDLLSAIRPQVRLPHCIILKLMNRANFIQVCVLGNHQNGKDTHIRGIRVFSPPVYVSDVLIT
jgi:hypothetical protein